MNTKPVLSQTFTSLGRWCWQRRSSLATLLAGLAIVVLSAASGYRDHTGGGEAAWLELAIYLCAVVVVATQGGRLIRGLAGLAQRPGHRLRDRSGQRPDRPGR